MSYVFRQKLISWVHSNDASLILTHGSSVKYWRCTNYYKNLSTLQNSVSQHDCDHGWSVWLSNGSIILVTVSVNSASEVLSSRALQIGLLCRSAP